jgi:transcriptional regulator with XRE-family HTH domain
MTPPDDAARETLDGDETVIARAVRARRLMLGLSLAAASRLSGISAPHLSRIESGDRVPAVTLLMRLARAYDVPLGVLVGEADEADPRGVTVRRRTPDERLAGAERSFDMLGSHSPHALLQPMRVTLTEAVSGDPQVHNGEEWVHVESGVLDVEIGGFTERLGAGDSIHFDAEIPHRLGRVGAASAVFLMVTSIAGGGHHRRG